jgi:poly-gamma-glutamate capsule biosynthesis protein CapA/YwtB (metallophosphatase superfamily)
VKRWRKLGVIVAVCAALLVAGAVYWVAAQPATKSVPATTHKVQAVKSLPAAPTVTGSYLMSGDVFWGRGMDYYAQRSPLKYDWPFSRLSEFHPEKYDGWITDLECPVTDITVPYQTQVDKLILQCPPQYLSAAAKYFTAFTIANNHTDNTGAQGFTDTRTNLDKAGLQYFGHYDLAQKDDLCEVISLPAKLNGQVAHLPIAMCGYHWLARDPTDAELAEITTYAKYFPVWVFPHGGTEYAIQHTPQQQAMYHQMIDRGASVVFGDHPHVVEDTEAYKGKLIVYNFGNLVYDQWFDDEVTKSLIVNTKITAKVDSNLQAYLNMGASCATFKDDCLSRAEQSGLHAPLFTYSYDVLAGDSSNDNDETRRKHPASPEVYQWLLKRTNWDVTKQGLTQSAI